MASCRTRVNFLLPSKCAVCRNGKKKVDEQDFSPLFRAFAYTTEFSSLSIDYRFLLAAYGILIQPSTDSSFFFPCLGSPARFRSFLVPLPIPCFPCTLLFPFPYFPPFQSPFPSCSFESERKKENDCQSFFLWRSGSAFCTSSNCTKSPSDVPSSDDDGMAAGAVAVAVADERDGRNHGQQCEANRLLIHLPVSAKISHSLSPFFMAGDDVIHESVEFEIFDTTRILLSRG